MESNNKNTPSSSSSRTDRKVIEKNRRNQMKALYLQLNSLVPHQPSRESISLPDQLFEAANYIKKLQVKLERMKERKASSISRGGGSGSGSTNSGGLNNVSLPNIEIRDIGSGLEIILITGLDCGQFMFGETLRVLHEEGAEVVNASFSVVEHTVFHTIHSKVGESVAACDASRISARLKNFVHSF